MGEFPTYHLISPDELAAVVTTLLAEGREIIAPVEHDTEPNKYKFDTLQNAADLRLEYDTTLIPPVQKVFMPKTGVTLVRWEKEVGSGKFVSSPGDAGRPLVLFGVHPYDIHGMQIYLDTMMRGLHPDPFVTQQYEKLTVVGLDVLSPPPDSFCASIGTHTVSSGYDALLTDLGSLGYLVEILTEKGRVLFEQVAVTDATDEHLGLRDAVRTRVAAAYPSTLDMPLDELSTFLEARVNHPYFDQVGGECVACVKCIVVCPTCVCSNTREEPALDGQSGTRVRHVDGCQNPAFDTMAGGLQIRTNQGNRMRIRLFHKLAYPIDDYDITCVGCGRCVKACPADIADPVQSIKLLQQEEVV